jgi:hypothetical protein
MTGSAVRLESRKWEDFFFSLLVAIVAGFTLSTASAIAYEEDWSPAREWNDLSVSWYINDDVDDLAGC